MGPSETSPPAVRFLNGVRRLEFLAMILILAAALPAHAAGSLQWSGFALLRGGTPVENSPLAGERLSTQMQLGIDWTGSPRLGAHVHVLARNDEGTRRGSFGIPEAYVEANFQPAGGRLRVRGGAFFLPTSRENVDALWENPYAISSSALNTWLGEEFRPIGVDVSYARRGVFGGATLYRGNDTFGALPPARGWRQGDHWTLLGEWVPVDDEFFTSLSAENDGRLGWSARGGWHGPNLTLQLTHIDNRSDGRQYGPLFNWGTRFDILGAEYTRDDWTFAAESGWGPTFLVTGSGRKFVTDLEASYVLVSRMWDKSRGTVRLERCNDEDGGMDHSVTLAWFWQPRGKVRLGAELTAIGSDRRALLEIRYHFSTN